eukprot:scaffold44635_cov66-Phaeocystis_antarctica.AAC.2
MGESWPAVKCFFQHRRRGARYVLVARAGAGVRLRGRVDAGQLPRARRQGRRARRARCLLGGRHARGARCDATEQHDRPLALQFVQAGQARRRGAAPHGRGDRHVCADQRPRGDARRVENGRLRPGGA